MEALHRFFTIGLATRLEPLPALSYDVVPVQEGDGPVDESSHLGHGQWLKPRMTPFAPLTFERAKQCAMEPWFRTCVEAWTRVFRLLDAVDHDPHFSRLRHFFDTRRPAEVDNAADGSEEASRPLERKVSTHSGSRVPMRWHWARRANEASTDAQTAPAASSYDQCDLFMEGHEYGQVRFPVRVDLDRIHLAHARSSSRPEVSDSPEDDPSARSDASQRSFVQRVLDRQWRRGSQASSNAAARPDSIGEPCAMDDSDDEEGLESPRHNGDELLPLLRVAVHYSAGSAWRYGDQDPLPVILMQAWADAVGWEGIMHLCYGQHSASQTEHVYSALGRAADISLHQREKHDAVLSWLDKMQHGDQEPKPQASWDTTSKAPVASVGQRSAPGHTRTWDDWQRLFSSLSSWVSEYETARVRACLAHEYGKEPAYSTRPNHVHANIPPSVAQDMLQGAHGFWRLDGIPDALRQPDTQQEHMDYRWARSRLESRQIGTPLVLATAAVQFCLKQLSSASWVYRSAWELDYLDGCILQSSIMRERFPPPGESPAPSLDPANATRDRHVPCPYPSTSGAWDPVEWRSWLGTLQDGQVIVPAVSWQGWWTLLAVLNGADRSGREFDLQVRAPGDPVHPEEFGSIYL